MSRRIRFAPDRGCLFEVTTRTLQGRYLLKPSKQLNRLIIGVLAKALESKTGVRLHAMVFMSTHHHMLVSVDDAEKLASFMCFVNSNIAREVARLHDWPGKVWGQRYQAILVDNEEVAQQARFRYLLSHGVKEGLCWQPEQWPGVQCVDHLLSGDRLTGCWIDRTRQSEARRRGLACRDELFATEFELQLDPLPCWKDLEAEQRRQRIADLRDEVVVEAKETHRRRMTRPRGLRKILRAAPHYRPGYLSRSPAPAFHAASKRAVRKMRDAYASFLAEYHRAAESVARGLAELPFPPGSFPSRRPFIPLEVS